MNAKKILSLSMASAMAAALLAGCGSTAAASSTAESTGTAAASSTAESTGTAAAAAGSTLTTVGKVDRLGGKLAFCSAEMTDETGKVIVRAHCVMCFTGKALPL